MARGPRLPKPLLPKAIECAGCDTERLTRHNTDECIRCGTVFCEDCMTAECCECYNLVCDDCSVVWEDGQVTCVVDSGCSQEYARRV
jgi:hypothetical protein